MRSVTNISHDVSEERPHRSWRGALKWTCGYLSVVAIGLTLIFFSLAHLTARDTSIEMISTTLATAFSPEGLDEPSDLEFLRHYLGDKDDGRIKPVPGLAIEITAADVENKSARDLRLLFFRRVAEPLYDEGPAGVAALAETDEMREAMKDGLGPLGFVNDQSHQVLSILWITLAAVSLMMLGGLVYFSRGFGRLISPGITLILAALPGAATFTILDRVARAVPAHAVDREDTSAMIEQILGNVMPVVAGSLARTHQLIMLIGLSLIILAAIGKFVRSIRSAPPISD